jgi:LPXTG-motif cell wall-anchored protein
VTVSEDGAYIYTDAKQRLSSEGTVTVTYDVYPDGSTNVWYTFRDTASGGYFANCCESAEPGVVICGQDGAVRLVSDTPVIIAPIAGELTPDALTGRWILKTDDGQDAGVVAVDENGSFFYASGSCEDEDFVNFAGEIIMHYDMLPDGTETAVFRFFDTEADSLFLSGTLCDDSTLCLEQGGTLIRDDSVRKASAADIAGTWLLKNQVLDADGCNTGEYETAGTVTVSYDAEAGRTVYSYAENGSDTVQTGTAYASYVLNPDLSTQIWYDFFDSNGEFWIGAQDLTRDNRNTLFVGMTAEQILTHEEAVPNDYGYYDADDVPESGISVTALDGEWIIPYVPFGNWEGGTAALFINGYNRKEGSFSRNSSFEGEPDLSGGGADRLQYQLDEEGFRRYFFVLYAGEDIFLVLDVNGDLPLEELSTAGEAPLTFMRSAEPYDAEDYLQLYDAITAPENLSMTALAGTWQENDSEYETILQFSRDESTFSWFSLTTYVDGSAEDITGGLAKLQYYYNAAGEREYLYALYVADDEGICNQILMTIAPAAALPVNELQLAFNEISFTRIADAPKEYVYSDEELEEMAMVDYTVKRGVCPEYSIAVTVLVGVPDPEGEVEIFLSDENCSDLDYYIVNADTGIGTDSTNKPVNLPQTGNNSLQDLLLVIGALLMTAFSFFAFRHSGMLRRKEETEI